MFDSRQVHHLPDICWLELKTTDLIYISVVLYGRWMILTKPNYTLKTYDALIIRHHHRWLESMQITVWGLTIAIIISAVSSHQNILQVVSLPHLFLLCVGLILFGFRKKDISYYPINVELQFYEDHLCVYYPKRTYDSQYIRKEIYNFPYYQLPKCTYNPRKNRLIIHGNGHLTFYKQKDGVIPQEPTIEKMFVDRKIKINTHIANDVDFKQIIENNSPLNVIIKRF